MKKLTLISIIAMIIISMTISIHAKPKPLNSIAYTNEVIRTQFLDKLERPDDSILNFSVDEAYVHFTINSMNEIVILTTGTSNTELDAYLKRTLNYERIDAKNILLEQDYYIKVTFHKSDAYQALL